MDAEPIALFSRKSLSLCEVEAILLTPPANFITDPPVNPKGDDVYLYKALNTIKEVKMSIGIPAVNERRITNLSQLRKNTRSKGDKRSGRKRPRRNDVESNALQIDETDETDQLKHLVGVGGSLTEKKKSRDDQAAQTEEVKLPAGEGDSTNEVELLGDEDNRTDEVRQPEGEDVRTDEVELRQSENYQDENMK
eukprot:Em0012g438a